MDEMERALQQDGEKLLQLTGENHGPWGDGCYCHHHPDDPGHGSHCYVNQRLIDAVHVVAKSISLRQSASETPAEFVRRIVGAWIEESAK